MQARAQLRSALLQHAAPESRAGLQAVHDYLLVTRGRCRGPADRAGPNDTAGSGSQLGGSGSSTAEKADAAQEAAAQGRAAHTMLVHAVQSCHSADPHLQREWADILVADGRFADAMQHYQVSVLLLPPEHAAVLMPPGQDAHAVVCALSLSSGEFDTCWMPSLKTIFVSVLFQAAGVMFTGQHAQQAGSQELLTLGLGRPMAAEEKAAGSKDAFDAALRLRPDPRSVCALLQSKCSALGWLAQEATSVAAEGGGGIAVLYNSCLNALQERRCALSIPFVL